MLENYIESLTWTDCRDLVQHYGQRFFLSEEISHCTTQGLHGHKNKLMFILLYLPVLTSLTKPYWNVNQALCMCLLVIHEVLKDNLKSEVQAKLKTQNVNTGSIFKAPSTDKLHLRKEYFLSSK